MEILHEIQNGILIITPKGESLDAKEAPEFKEKVLRLINETRVPHVIVNMNHFKSIDSSGLGCFLAMLRRINEENGGELKLVQLSKPVRSMFELVSMHRIFDIFTTLDDAQKSCKTGIR